MERLSAGAKSDPVRSPYAPEQGDEDAGAERPAGDAAVDESRTDVDLARLEESLRWLQRQEAAYRLPRVAPLPLVPRLVQSDTLGYGREKIGGPRPKSLEPEVMPPPPAAPRRRYLSVALALFTASVVLAAAGYYVARTGWSPPLNSLASVQIGTSSPISAASPPSVAARATRPIVARDDDPDPLLASEESDRAHGIAQLANMSERNAMAMVPADEPETQIPAGMKAPRALDPDAIKLLVKQGEQFATAGDLVSARVVFQRAAQAGDAKAALALGATYDPVVHAQIGAAGLSADIEQARTWYRKAESLGSSEATRRLQARANR